jgi:single-stranded-DNA-specific exonuclease
MISQDDLKKKVRIDTPLGLEAIDAAFLEHYARLVPFGVGNPKPVFLTEGLEVADEPKTMQGRHVKFRVRRNGRSFDVLGWDKADLASRLRRGDSIDLAFTLHISQYLGEEQVSLAVEDIRV